MKIAALCAAPNDNTGMMFVDRALYYYLEEKKILEFTTFFCFEFNAVNNVGFKYEALTKDINLNDFDVIIIWGDFTVSKHFLDMTSPKISKKSKEFDYDLKRKILLSDFTDEELKKVIVFGQCIFVDDRSSLKNEQYITGIKRLLRESQLFKVRDPFSSHRAKILGNKNRDFLGVDSALLNCHIDRQLIKELRLSKRANESDTIGVFFARSKKILRKKKSLGIYLKFKFKNVQLKWIPWLKNKQDSKKFFYITIDSNPITDIDYIKEILSCKLIITDTYHLSLMAWSLGVPCICYGNAAENFKSTVHDKKKEVFYTSNYLNDFYFFNETFYSDLKNKKLFKIIKSMMNSTIGEDVAEDIYNASDLATKSLDKAIFEIVSRTKKTPPFN
jgi:hypothetical protein